MERGNERRRLEISFSRTNHRICRVFDLQHYEKRYGFHSHQRFDGRQQSGRNRNFISSSPPRAKIAGNCKLNLKKKSETAFSFYSQLFIKSQIWNPNIARTAIVMTMRVVQPKKL